MKTITQRAVEWNAARYDREYDYNLAISLLLEESGELYEAESVVDKLDAVADIVFVAIGTLWKLGFDEAKLNETFYQYDMRSMTLEDSHHWMLCISIYAFDVIDADLEGAYPGLSLALFSVFITALGTLRGLGLQNLFYDIVHVVCDSNDTKEVEGKTPAGVKANVFKGNGYVGPEEALQKLYIDDQKRRSVH